MPYRVSCSSDNWGGTVIQHWMSAAALAKCTPTPDSTLYNAMIHPLQVGPLALTGVVWYQVRTPPSHSRFVSRWDVSVCVCACVSVCVRVPVRVRARGRL